MKTLKPFVKENDWTLFLDRDGVVNEKRENDYVKSWEEFKFIENSSTAISTFSKIFKHIVIVTNQQGIGKGLFTHKDLEAIHANMLRELERDKGRIDKIYYCASLKEQKDPCRKPGVGMALQAKKDLSEIEFSRSIIAGDSHSDMQFGKKLGMITVYIHEKPEPVVLGDVDFHFTTLYEFSKALERAKN